MATTVEIIWDKHRNYVIRDVHEKMQEKVPKFMLEKYFIPHRLYNQLKFQEDPEVNEQYLKYVEHILRDESSVIVVDESTNNIYAVALGKCMTNEWHSWTSLKLCINPCKFTDIIELQHRLMREFAAEVSEEIFDTYHLFEYYIDDNLKQDYEFIGKFFNAIYETARHLKMQQLTFLALSQAEQQRCLEQGYDSLYRAIYSIFTEKKRRPFAALRDIDEMEAILYGIDVDPLIPFYKMKVRGIDEVEPPKVAHLKTSSKAISLRSYSLTD